MENSTIDDLIDNILSKISLYDSNGKYDTTLSFNKLESVLADVKLLDDDIDVKVYKLEDSHSTSTEIIIVNIGKRNTTYFTNCQISIKFSSNLKRTTMSYSIPLNYHTLLITLHNLL